MQQTKKDSPLLRIWGWGKDEHGRLIGAVISALAGVLLGLLPYYAAAQVIIGMLAWETDLSVSHKATFSILKTIRQKILAKLLKLPLGTVMDMSGGKMKQVIVDQVDGMETTQAHLFPELTANVAAPLFIVVCLFAPGWRMALLAIVTIPAGMVFMMSVMGSCSKDYEGTVKTTQEKRLSQQTSSIVPSAPALSAPHRCIECRKHSG